MTEVSSPTQVVVSVGTDHHPFERLLDWMTIAQDTLDVDVLIQRGATDERSGLRTVDYLQQAELDEAFEAADVVVCHGGPGTIAAARRHGHRPIVVARNPRHGEHVDDHQMRYSAKLAAEDAIDLAASSDDLLRLIVAPRERVAVERRPGDANEGVRDFAELIDRFLDGQIPRRRWRDRIRLRRTP